MGSLLFNSLLFASFLSSVQGIDTHINNRTDTGLPKEEIREPRSSRRVVKLYSGTRPKPIVCNGEGFQADPDDCSIFHRCLKSGNGRYLSFKFQCGPGTIYDPDAEICNHPETTKRSECGGKFMRATEATFDNEINEEVPLPISTKETINLNVNTVIDPSKSKATTMIPGLLNEITKFSWASSNKKQSESTSKGSLASTTNSPSTSTTSQKLIPTSPRSVTFNNRLQTSQLGEICTSNGFMGDRENCRKFYRCVGNQRGGFIRYEFLCNDPTIWDDEKQACNHAWLVQKRRCGRESSGDIKKHGNLKESMVNQNGEVDTSQNTENNKLLLNRNNELDESTPVSQTQLQVNYGSKVSQHQTQISKGNVKQNQTQINYNKNGNAKQNQTQISHGSATSQSQSQINFGDKGVQTQLQIDHSNESSQSQSQIIESTTASGSNQPSTKAPGSNNVCTESGFISDSDDCKKFYRCVDNGRGSFTRYEFSCGDGTVWDSNLESCNHAWAVEGCGGKGSSKNPIYSSQSTTLSTITTTSSTTMSTQNYYISEEPITEESNDIQYGNQQSSAPTGKPFTSISTETNKPESVDDNKCKDSGFMGDNSDCKKFYRCVDNGNGQYTRFEFSCGEGTVWDSKIEACNHAWAVEKCGGNNIHDNDKVESTTIKEIHTTQTLPQTTSQIPSQNDDYDTGYGQQHDQYPSSTTVTRTTSAFMSTTTITSSSSTSLNQNSDNTCKSSGFMGDSKDCNKFYRCVDNGNGAYTRYEFNCGDGTVWDQKIQACNHPWAVEKCGGTSIENESPPSGSDYTTYTTTQSLANETLVSSTESEYQGDNHPIQDSSSSTSKPLDNICSQEGYYADRNNCKNFYRCVDNGQGGYTKYDFTCGEGTLWNQEIQACDHESENKHCGSIDSKPTTKAPVTENDVTVTESTTKGSPPSTSESSYELQESHHADATCKNEGFYGDPNDCKMFYRCVDNGKGGYTKYEFTCGDGTFWDQEILTCNHVSNDARCKNNVLGTSSTTNEPNLGNVQNSTHSQQEQNSQVTESSETPSNDKCREEGFFANSNDCKKFYRCVRNDKGSFTKYEFSCGEGTVWVQEIQACDHDNGITSCANDNISQTTEEAQYSTSSTQSTIQSQENDEYSEGNPEKPSSSTKRCTSEGFYANENDCKQFYRCVDNGKGGYTKYDFTCGEGTAWDSNIQSCNHISEVKSCHSFNQDGSQMEPTMHDEETSQTTESTTNESTSSESSNPNNDSCKKEGYFGNTQDCTKFYRCVDNGKGGFTKYDFDCGEGTIWDQDVITCNHPQDVTNPSCKTQEEGSATSSTESSSNTSSSTMSSSTSSATSETTQDNTQNNNSQNSSCTDENSSEKPDQQIKCEKAGFYANPNDCKKFYRCVDWDGKGEKFSVYHFECGEGTIWDPQLDTCNHEESVYPPRNCSGSQNESASQETTTTEKSTTQENTSTSQSTTTEKTTTQQSTSSEQTTQQSTTSEQTTQHSTTATSEQTTQPPTTSEQTTQQSTTSEQTTEQSTTSEQTTTQQSTTEQIKETTTTESNEETTTEQTTTQGSTSELSTDSENASTTEQSTTEQQTPNDTTTSTTTTTTEKDDSTTTESTINTTTEETSSQNKECPETEDDQYLYVCPTSFKRHPKYCNMFYQCTEDEDSHEIKIATFTCPNDTIYDENQTQCVEEDKADKKCDGQKARKHRVKRLNLNSREPIEVDQHQHKCKTEGYYPFEKSNECSRVFLKCQQTRTGKLRGHVYQCPESYVFWNISKRCEKMQNMKYCQSSNSRNWNNRWEIPVEKKNLAK